MSTQPWYTTREIVKLALDVKATAQADWQIDDAIEAASRLIEQRTHRVFYPWTGTRYLDWPDPQNGTSYVLWLEENELISLDTLTSGGVAIGSSLYNLEPGNTGPPFDRIELKLSSSGAFGQGGTAQRDVAATGLFGYRNTEAAAGALAAAVANAVTTTISVTQPPAVGVGDLLRIGTERVIVTGRAFADSGQDAAALDALNSATSVSVADGTVFNPGEVIAIDTEKMRVDFVIGNTLAVARAQDGTALAAHTANTSVYRETALTVERGVLGTTAAVHAQDAAVLRWVPPPLVGQLARAQALDTVLQEQSGYARTVGSGDNARNASGNALGSLWARVEDNFRRIRIGVI
jgi:hypothetical protein